MTLMKIPRISMVTGWVHIFTGYKGLFWPQSFTGFTINTVELVYNGQQRKCPFYKDRFILRTMSRDFI